jgi:MFS family permease
MEGQRGRAAVRRLALARFLSSTGSQIAGIALSAEIYRQTGSAVWLSAAFFFTFGVTGFLTPVAGAIADRFDRRATMVISDVAGAIVWTILLVGDGPVWLISVGFVASVVSTPFYLAADAAMPNIVDADHLAWANGLVAVGRNTARVAGPALGGAIAGAFGSRTAFVVNALSFLISATLVATVRARFHAEATEEAPPPDPGIWGGFRIVWRDPGLRSLAIVWTTLWLTIDFAVVADLPLSVAFGWGDRGYGLMNAAFGAGALIGALMARRLPRRWEGPAVVAECLGVAVGYVLTGLAPFFVFVLLGQAIAAGIDTIGEVGGTSIVQRSAPDHVRGRVLGALVTAGLIANALGFSVAGFAVEAAGPRAVYVACGVLSALVIPLLRPFLRQARAAEAADAAADLAAS